MRSVCQDDSRLFKEALKKGDLNALRKIAKSDLHNHFVLGGSRKFIFKKTGIDIKPCESVLQSMEEMHAWNEKYIGSSFNSKDRRKLLIAATFVQAKQDGIRVLEIGEDVWGLGEYFNHDIERLIEAFEEAHEEIAPEIELRLQIGLSRHCPIAYLMECLEHFWGHPAFYSIDLYGDELAQPIHNFIPIYEKAKENGLVLKAHIGEWGSAKDIMEGARKLHLDEVQHGIVAASCEETMAYLKENKIRLNITPTSNLMLGRVKDLSNHPIQVLYRKGLDVTINSDDVLIFDSDVSKEYLRLFEAGCLTEEELDNIRLNGLKKVK